MEYLHVKSLEKYHPGYKDRTLQWAKIYINMAEGDPETELIDNEIDWSRLIKFILLELRAQKPLPISDAYWTKKGFNIEYRPMCLTLNMLHNFLTIVTEDEKHRYESVTQIRVDKSKIRVDNIKSPVTKKSSLLPTLHEVKDFMKNDAMAENFFDYYQSNGWKIGGRAPMRDWKAAARNWMRVAAKNTPTVLKTQNKPIGLLQAEKLDESLRHAAPPPKEFTDLARNLAAKKAV